MKTEGEGIREILESGQLPNCYSFRVPQPWSSWCSGKATAREMAKQRHKPERQAFSIATKQGKDIPVPVRNPVE